MSGQDNSMHIALRNESEIITAHLNEARAERLLRPSSIFLPKLFIDGNMWCALFGENLQDGVAGFGTSPDEAYKDFDKSWSKPLC